MQKACPLCSATSHKPLGHKLHQDYFRCNRCGAVIGSSIWESSTENDAETIYDETYLAKSGKMHPKTTQRYHEMLDVVEGKTGGRRMVEVGFGNGQFLLAAKDRGWEARGVEISRAACRYVNEELGIEALCGKFEEVPIEPNSLDLVASMETIEHLYQPQSLIERSRELLKEGGVLFLTTPNAGCLTQDLIGMEWRGYYTGHTVLFTVRRLKKLLKDSGFRVYKVETRTIIPRTIINVWKSRLKGRKDKSPGVTHLPGNIKLTEAQDLRDKVEGNPILRMAKSAINLGLNLTNKGEKTLIWATKV